MQMNRLIHLLSPQRYRRCKQLFVSPGRAFFAASFILKKPKTLQTKKGTSITLARTDAEFWNWYFATPACTISAEANNLLKIHYNNKQLLLRPNTKDMFVFCEIFVNGEYDLFDPSQQFDTVIDIGAHIGIFSSTLASQTKHLIAVEAASENYALALNNIKANGGNTNQLLHRAVTNTSHEQISLYKCRHNSGGHSLHQSWIKLKNRTNVEKVETIALSDVINLANGKSIDILKCDIEGGEYALFTEQNIPLLKTVKKILLELHVNQDFTTAMMNGLIKTLHAAGFTTRFIRPPASNTEASTKARGYSLEAIRA